MLKKQGLKCKLAVGRFDLKPTGFLMDWQRQELIKDGLSIQDHPMRGKSPDLVPFSLYSSRSTPSFSPPPIDQPTRMPFTFPNLPSPYNSAQTFSLSFLDQNSPSPQSILLVDPVSTSPSPPKKNRRFSSFTVEIPPSPIRTKRRSPSAAPIASTSRLPIQTSPSKSPSKKRTPPPEPSWPEHTLIDRPPNEPPYLPHYVLNPEYEPTRLLGWVLPYERTRRARRYEEQRSREQSVLDRAGTPDSAVMLEVMAAGNGQRRSVRSVQQAPLPCQLPRLKPLHPRPYHSHNHTSSSPPPSRSSSSRPSQPLKDYTKGDTYWNFSDTPRWLPGFDPEVPSLFPVEFEGAPRIVGNLPDDGEGDDDDDEPLSISMMASVFKQSDTPFTSTRWREKDTVRSAASAVSKAEDSQRKRWVAGDKNSLEAVCEDAEGLAQQEKAGKSLIWKSRPNCKLLNFSYPHLKPTRWMKITKRRFPNLDPSITHLNSTLTIQLHLQNLNPFFPFLILLVPVLINNHHVLQLRSHFFLFRPLARFQLAHLKDQILA